MGVVTTLSWPRPPRLGSTGAGRKTPPVAARKRATKKQPELPLHLVFRLSCSPCKESRSLVSLRSSLPQVSVCVCVCPETNQDSPAASCSPRCSSRPRQTSFSLSLLLSFSPPLSSPPSGPSAHNRRHRDASDQPQRLAHFHAGPFPPRLQIEPSVYCLPPLAVACRWLF